MTDCDKARETINPLELPMRNFASALASHLNHYFASITAPTLRATFSTQSVDCGPSRIVRESAAAGGLPTFAERHRGDGVAPIAVLHRQDNERGDSTLSDHSLPYNYSMTSSARARRDCGTARPSASAVLRLMTSSNLVGCWTGRAAGLAALS